jgi:Trypsin
MNKRVVAAVAVAVVAVAVAPAARAEAHVTNTAKPGHVAPRHIGIQSLSAADRARQVAQEPLLRLNDRVFDVTARQYNAHFAGATVDTAHRRLIVYWAGSVSRKLAGLRSEAVRSSVTLLIKPARFSRSWLMQAADQVVPSSVFAGTRVSVDIANDGSGLTVHAGDLPAAARGTKAPTSVESQLLGRIAVTHRRTGIPITVAAAPPGKPQFSSRLADSSPFWAGALIRMPQDPNGLYPFCTSGFSMYASGAPSTRFTLTAAHCPNFLDGVAITNGVGTPMGTSDFIHELYDHQDPAYDLGVVRLNSGLTNAPFIYVGDNPGDGVISVAGYASGGVPSGGNYCVHGATAINCELISGGTHKDCGNNPIPWPPLGRCVYTIDFHSKHPNTIVICGGDSGGPVYYWSGNAVIAAGIVSWGRPATNTWSPILKEDVPCAYQGGISVVATAVNNISGLRVVTLTAP